MGLLKKMKWDATFSVGVPAMDAEHQRIIGLINALQDQFAVASTPAATADLLAQMTRYANEHFRHEEQLLAERNYPRLLEQRAQHAGYRKKNLALGRETPGAIVRTPEALHNFLRHWWTQHILTEDMRYKAFLAQHPAP